MNFEILAFNSANFYGALSTRESPVSLVQIDEHANYLLAYLGHADIGAKTIVVESSYVDRDYLEDFAAFYFSCFPPYDRHCTRVHFFSTDTTRAQFRKIIAGDASKTKTRTFTESYLGFVVVRPLPSAIIGRTQIKTYSPDHGRRHYPAVRIYGVNLFGLRLEVRSMAFQEQDRAVAACATVALWSCFQQTSELFGTASPRPPAITKSASQALYFRRSLPSIGLTTEQICEAIRWNGLEPEVFRNPAITPSLIYAYLQAGIPLLMIAEIETYVEQTHAIVLNGFSMLARRFGEEQLFADANGNLTPGSPHIGGRINEFYGHDDQKGPFAHLYVTMPTAANEPFTLTGNWKTRDGSRDAIIKPVQIIAPVYGKIRLSYLDALNSCLTATFLAERVLTTYNYARDAWEWDVHLTTTSKYKSALREETRLPSDRKAYLLTKAQPRFFWRFLLRLNGQSLMELCVDATQFTKSNPLFLVNHFNAAFAGIYSGTASTLQPNANLHPSTITTLATEYQIVE